ncbi:hypothetical protein JTB14_029923 [Gonioctena quinquepunctata]|nr:hypothetical protein JTB14_029923 [Gonioctena quinquepunctata]
MCSVHDLYTRRKYNYVPKESKTLHKIIKNFSLLENLEKLNSLAGLKVISMFIVIYAHRSMFIWGSPLLNPEFLEKVNDRPDPSQLDATPEAVIAPSLTEEHTHGERTPEVEAALVEHHTPEPMPSTSDQTNHTPELDFGQITHKKTLDIRPLPQAPPRETVQLK